MRCERTMREVRLNAGKQQGSAPRAVDWPVRSPATFTRCDLSLSKTPNGAILPQNHLESGECRFVRELPSDHHRGTVGEALTGGLILLIAKLIIGGRGEGARREGDCIEVGPGVAIIGLQMTPRVDEVKPGWSGPVEQHLRKIALCDTDFGADRTLRQEGGEVFPLAHHIVHWRRFLRLPDADANLGGATPRPVCRARRPRRESALSGGRSAASGVHRGR